MIGGYPHDSAIGDSLGGCWKASASQRGRLGKAVTAGHNVNSGLFPGPIDPVMLCPAVDHDEERRRRVALSANGLARLQHHRGSRRNNVLNRFRLESAEYANPGDDLQITS